MRSRRPPRRLAIGNYGEGPEVASREQHPAPGALAFEALLTPADVAARWQVTVGQVQRLARQGNVPHVRVGRYLRFRADQVEAWERGGGADEDGQADA